MFLLDLNLLIALVDPDHVHHPQAFAFFNHAKKVGWATCPLTENGFLRILGSSSYPKGPGSPQLTRRLLEQLCSQPGHQFWPDSISLCHSKLYPKLPPSKHLTDYYLLALAIKNHSSLATFDRAINPSHLIGGANAYHLLR